VTRIATILREDWRLAVFIFAILLVTVLAVRITLNRPEPLSYPPTDQAIEVVDSTGAHAHRATTYAPDRWQFFSLRAHRIVTRPGKTDWDLACQRFHVSTNGGPGFAGQGSAGVIDANAQPPALRQTSADTTESGFGKWYNYSFTSHLLKPKPEMYRVHAADGTPYDVRILSYYCTGATPGCITIQYKKQGS